MKTFKTFITEAVREAELYHNTSLISLFRILEMGKLTTFDTEKWDAHKGYTHPTKGWISFSRSRHYTAAPGAYAKTEAKLVFSFDKIRQRYKMKAHADLAVADPDGWKDDKTVKGAASRWESEERVYGPVKINDSLVRIELSSAAKADLHRWIEAAKANIKEQEVELERVESGYFYNQVTKKITKIESEKQKKFHNVGNVKARIESYKKDIEKYESLLNHPKLR